MNRFVIALCGLFVMVPVSGFSAENWTATKCGVEPAVPVVKTGSVAQYNESVDRVKAYEKAARAYNSCVSGQANREETAISQEAAARISHIHAGSSVVRARIAGAFQKLSTQLAAGGKKLGTR